MKLKLYLWVSWAILLISAVYISMLASSVQTNVGDQFVSAYMISDWKPGEHLNLMAQHTNLMKFPLFWIQGHLPNWGYYLINALLVVSTVSLWSYLVFRITKSTKSLIASNLLLSGILLASVPMGISITMPTIRNIEYPLALLYLYLNKDTWSRWIICVLLLALLIASDFFFLLLPLAVLCVYVSLMLLSRIKTKQFIWTASNAAIGVIVGLAVVKLLGLVIFNYVPSDKAAFDLSGLFAQTWFALQELAKLIGWAWPLFLIIFWKIKKPTNLEWMMYSIAVLIFVAYVASGYATGANIRYLTLLPFIFVLFMVKRDIRLAIAVFLTGLLAAIPNYSIYLNRKDTAWLDLNKTITSHLDNEHVGITLSTIGYAAPTWYLSNKQHRVYNIQPCNIGNQVLSNSGWYHYEGGRSALIIDRLYSPAAKWETWAHCPDEELMGIYGVPEKKIIAGFHLNKPVEIWVYDYDIRTQLR